MTLQMTKTEDDRGKDLITITQWTKKFAFLHNTQYFKITTRIVDENIVSGHCRFLEILYNF